VTNTKRSPAAPYFLGAMGAHTQKDTREMRNELKLVMLSMLTMAACAGTAETPAYAAATPAHAQQPTSTCAIEPSEGYTGCEANCFAEQAFCTPATTCPVINPNDEEAVASSGVFACTAAPPKCECRQRSAGG
jgi:hypothetical protein